MSKYDYEDYPEQKKGSRLDTWDMMSIFTLLIMFCLVLYFYCRVPRPGFFDQPAEPSQGCGETTAHCHRHRDPTAAHLDAYLHCRDRDSYHDLGAHCYDPAHLDPRIADHTVHDANAHQNTQGALHGQCNLYR